MPGDEIDQVNPFDKFMDDLCKRENEAKEKSKAIREADANLPARRYNELYGERWQNRIKYR